MIQVYNSSKIEISEAGGAVVTAHNGVVGESVDVLLYLKNSDSTVYYDNIKIDTEDTDGDDDTLGVYGTGRGFKLSAGARRPTDIEWENLLAGDFISMPDIGTSTQANTTTYYPFWMRVIVPGNTQAQTFTDVDIKVTAVEHAV